MLQALPDSQDKDWGKWSPGPLPNRTLAQNSGRNGERGRGCFIPVGSEATPQEVLKRQAGTQPAMNLCTVLLKLAELAETWLIPTCARASAFPGELSAGIYPRGWEPATGSFVIEMSTAPTCSHPQLCHQRPDRREFSPVLHTLFLLTHVSWESSLLWSYLSSTDQTRAGCQQELVTAQTLAPWGEGA